VTFVYKDVLCKLVKWNEDSLKCQLPLVASTSVDVSVTVFGLSDFMSSDQHTCMSYYVNILFSLPHVKSSYVKSLIK